MPLSTEWLDFERMIEKNKLGTKMLHEWWREVEPLLDFNFVYIVFCKTNENYSKQ